MPELDPDQYRTVQLLRYGKYQETTMVSESGAYTLYKALILGVLQ
ncbi:hypothetical protein [Pseudomonas putida]